MAAVSPVPVVNLLSDRAHPLQTIADLLCLRDHHGHLDGLAVAWIGDCNNVAASLGLGLAGVGAQLRLACPPGYGADALTLERWRSAGLEPVVTGRPLEAAAGADAVYTDTWTSMGQEAEADLRRRVFEGFTVDDRVMAAAAAKAVFLHCLPAHRGEEVTAAVLDGPQSLVWPQAAHRLSAARGALAWLAAASADGSGAEAR
jgi:ornithine carbamoyltransferase